MNLKQMEVFRAVISCGSVTEAAKKLGKSHPAISKSIHSFEEDIGFSLFERRNRKMIPTPEAKYLFTEINDVFSRFQCLSQTVHDMKNQPDNFLRIGCMLGPSVFFMPELISDFVEQYPEVQVSLQTRTSNTLKEWFASGQYDIGLMDITDWDPSIETEQYTLPCICALPAKHPLAKQKILTPSLLNNEPMICIYEEHLTNQALRHQFESSGNRMNTRARTRFFIPALEMVEKGIGVCILDPIAVKGYTRTKQPGKVVFRQFEPNIPFPFWLICPANRVKKPEIEIFSKLLRTQIKEIQENIDHFYTWGDS